MPYRPTFYILFELLPIILYLVIFYQYFPRYLIVSYSITIQGFLTYFYRPKFLSTSDFTLETFRSIVMVGLAVVAPSFTCQRQRSAVSGTRVRSNPSYRSSDHVLPFSYLIEDNSGFSFAKHSVLVSLSEILIDRSVIIFIVSTICSERLRKKKRKIGCVAQRNEDSSSSSTLSSLTSGAGSKVKITSIPVTMTEYRSSDLC